MTKYKSFETARLELIPTNLNDAEFIFKLLNSPKWLANIGDRNISSIDDAKKYIEEKFLTKFAQYGYSNYTVVRKTDRAKMGSCGLYTRDGIAGVDIGFAFLAQFENQGYAFESANRLKQAAFHDFNLKELSAITTKDNKPSQKLLGKLGMKFEKYITLPNDSEELLFYKLKLSAQV